MSTSEPSSSSSSVASLSDSEDASISNTSTSSQEGDNKPIPGPCSLASKKKIRKKSSKISENVRVICRFRPEDATEKLNGSYVCVECLPDQKTVKISTSKGDIEDVQIYEYDKVFDMNATQEEVYMDVAEPLVNDVLDGFNAAVIAYGQTGSGKTFTMQGPGFEKNTKDWTSNKEMMGIIPRIVEKMFHNVSLAPGHEEYVIVTSFVEIYLEKIRDLLTPEKNNLTIMEDKKKGLWVTDATEVPVKTIKEVAAVMKTGLANRFVAETKCNTESSRSHAIFLITVYKSDFIEKVTKTSQLYLVDLAGSERASKSQTTGLRLDEAKTINTSLLALRQVIYALTSKKKKTHIPYRDSKLTRMLQNSFGGNSHTALVLNCSPSKYNIQETISSLRFGERARTIKNKPKANKQRSIEELTKLLESAQEEIQQQNLLIKQLQNELKIHKAKGDNSTKGNIFSDSFDFISFQSFFLCPITKKIMSDPVIASDGYTYEKTAFLDFINISEKKKRILKSPVTKQRLTSKWISPNFLIRTQMQYFKSFCADSFIYDEFSGTISSLPDELLRYICFFLPPEQVTTTMKVNHRFCRICNNPELWKEFLRIDFAIEESDIPKGINIAKFYWDTKKIRTPGNNTWNSNQKKGKGLYLFSP